MARRFAKVSGEEIVAINEAAFFCASDLVNTKTTIPHGVGEERWIYIPRYTSTTIHFPFGDSCMVKVSAKFCESKVSMY